MPCAFCNESGTRPRVLWTRARPAPAAAMRRLRSRQHAALHGLPRRPAADRAAALRALWASDGLGGTPLSRMCGTATGVRERAGGRPLRRRRALVRRRLEGAGATAARGRGGLGRARGRRAAAWRGRHVRPGRPRSRPEARPPPAGKARRGARTRIAAAARRLGAPPRRKATAWPLACRAAPQRRPCIRHPRGGPAFARPRGRRVHEWRDRQRGCVGAAKGRGAPRRGRDFRAGGEIDFVSCSFA